MYCACARTRIALLCLHVSGTGNVYRASNRLACSFSSLMCIPKGHHTQKLVCTQSCQYAGLQDVRNVMPVSVPPVTLQVHTPWAVPSHLALGLARRRPSTLRVVPAPLVAPHGPLNGSSSPTTTSRYAAKLRNVSKRHGTCNSVRIQVLKHHLLYHCM